MLRLGGNRGRDRDQRDLTADGDEEGTWMLELVTVTYLLLLGPFLGYAALSHCVSCFYRAVKLQS